MMLIGVIWAAFAPLLLVPVILGVARLLRKRGSTRPGMQAMALVLVPVAAVYAYDRSQFAKLCRETGRPVVSARAVADGIYLNSSTANSFGARYLSEEGFSWLERRDIYVRNGFVRVTREPDGRMVETKIPAISARYEVAEIYDKHASAHGVSWIKVIDRETGAEMARAGDANFLGGKMSWVLGAYGSASCLSAMSDPKGFRDYYHLARNTLRP